VTQSMPLFSLPSFGRWRIDNLDAVDWLRGLPDESVDLVVTDTAYESLEKHRAIGTTTRLTGAWFPIFPNARFGDLFRELYRVLKPNTHCYFFCDQETMFVAKPVGEAAGFRFWKPIVWDKVKMGMGYHYRARCEFILFFEKGKRNLASKGIPDVLGASRIRNGYPTEKPVPLLSILIGQSSKPNDIVIDPFSGSGATGAAALMLQRRYLGCDVVPGAVETSRERLSRIGARREQGAA
jgi:site-specific DNA-methyltransferase (adenine-specific)